jgi:acetylornithine/N-succinyldiaminopimelate aminotransferase
MLSATGNAKYLAGYGPPVEGFDHVPFGNMNAVRDAIRPDTAGILVEPIQGEGGVRMPPAGFLRDLRAACDEYGIFLALDEVQCGMGRTGKLFAHEHAGIVPDAISLAKGIAGGFPMGSILAREALAKHMTPGTHGTTFGGNPLACAAANAVLDVILAPGFLDHVAGMGRRFAAQLADLVQEVPAVFDGVRGQGLMVGLHCVVPNTQVQDACLQEQLLTVAAGDNTLRLVPPLIVTADECAEAAARLRRAALRCLPAPLAMAAT